VYGGYPYPCFFNSNWERIEREPAGEGRGVRGLDSNWERIESTLPTQQEIAEVVELGQQLGKN
jgi:hypothetical protein